MVLLVNPAYQRAIRSIAQTSVGPPMGLAYLASSLEAAGVDVAVLDANALDLDQAETVRRIVDAAPDVLGLTAATPTIDLCVEVAEGARAAGWSGEQCTSPSRHQSPGTVSAGRVPRATSTTAATRVSASPVTSRSKHP